MFNRFTYLSIAAIAMFIATGAFAQHYPTKPIRITIPTAPGGNPDFIARPIAQKMSEAMKQPIVIDNRPGANTIIGAQVVAKAKPDGYTIGGVSDSTVTYVPILQKRADFDALAAFEQRFQAVPAQQPPRPRRCRSAAAIGKSIGLSAARSAPCPPS